MQTTEAATEKTLKTCLVTLVNPGLPDSCIKVYPAEHAAEKIWLNTAPGQTRWRFVQNFLNRFVSRDEVVPKPVFLCSPPDFATRTVSEDQIPVAKLEGNAVLKALPEEETIVTLALKKDAEEKQAPAERMAKLEQAVVSLATSVAAIASRLEGFGAKEMPAQGDVEVKRGPGRPRKED